LIVVVNCTLLFGGVKIWTKMEKSFIAGSKSIAGYATAWVNETGELCFEPDIYGYDKRLERFLNGTEKSGPDYVIDKPLKHITM
jgi:hypothetical protein